MARTVVALQGKEGAVWVPFRVHEEIIDNTSGKSAPVRDPILDVGNANKVTMRVTVFSRLDVNPDASDMLQIRFDIGSAPDDISFTQQTDSLNIKTATGCPYVVETSLLCSKRYFRHRIYSFDNSGGGGTKAIVGYQIEAIPSDI
jgi:hypothetical protein